MGAFTFGAPLVLAGFLALPLIWWLLRLTPPRPSAEAFPPLAILQRVHPQEETAAHSPWWLTLLRLVLAALVVLALAAPILNPREAVLSGNGPVAILVDNGWASAADWAERRRTAEMLVEEAADQERAVALAFTAEGADDIAAPQDAAAALERLAAAEPRPAPVRREAAASRLADALQGQPAPSLALLLDGLDAPGTAEAAERLLAIGPTDTLLYAPSSPDAVALVAAENAADALVVQAIRPEGVSVAIESSVRALDAAGREIARAPLLFAAGAARSEARVHIPVELRNEVTRVDVEGSRDVAGVRLLDDSFRRRRVALVSGEASDLAQPLLSPLYYISRALDPFADLARAANADLAVAVPLLLEQNPSVVVLADIGVLPDTARAALERFVDGGGTLVRFAGPRLAATTAEDTLVPVRLRSGERQLGGALSWSTPQPVAPIPDTSPFAGIVIADDIAISRQVLAEPSATLERQTWASLADGTPIVTAATRGAGTILLFHTTAEATWSNLPISGAFVEMLRRVVALSQGAGGPAGAEAGLLPFRTLDAAGRLGAPPADARPLAAGTAEAPPPVTIDNPPGLYGSESGAVALNLFTADATLRPLPPVVPGTPVRPYGETGATALAPWLLMLALALFVVDALAVLFLSGVLARARRGLSARRAATAAAATLLALALPFSEAKAQGAEDFADFDVERALAATETTHLAYVVTGDGAQDEISRQGLAGLSQFIAAKTALEPGEPMAVDIEQDELSFFPIVYWPVDPTAPMPSDTAMSRIDAYMKQGGTVLFDISDGAGAAFGAVSEGQRRLRDILADLDIPPLEPVPAAHVLTKSFYIMSEFPGRHAGTELWVEAGLSAEDREAEPASGSDGVSSILVSSADFASAWAVDDSGLFVFPTDSSDPSQREYAYRAGVNIVMYVLTGNYKADQVHVPALLERLGQ